MTERHPSETTLYAHAMGKLPAAHSRVLAMHIDHCEICSETLLSVEELGGAFLGSLPPVALSADALEQTFDRLPDDSDPAPEPDPINALGTGKWLWVAPGIRIMPVEKRDATGTRLDLIRVSSGATLPVHNHRGRETVCVLQGSFCDEDAEFRRFDIAEGASGLTHTSTASSREDCICLTATTGRLRPQGVLARLVLNWIGL